MIGLLAYALFKQAVREEVRAGAAVPGDSRNPSPTTVKTYRAAAEQLFTDALSGAIEQATPEIQQSAILAAIDGSQSRLESHITGRTGFGQALFTNLIAWVLTLAIAALILFLANRPSVEQSAVKALEWSQDAPTTEQGNRR